MIIAFGHSLLAMSGFETLAQVYREIASPKLKNLKITANIVCIYALLSTGLLTFLSVMIIPDAIRSQYYDNLIGGLTMSLAGPHALKLVFHIFVVMVGALILSGAVNTSIIGANGVLEPGGRGRRARRLVSQAAQEVRHDAPPDQLDRPAAVAHDHRQPRRRLPAGRGVRVRRGVEFFLKGLGVLALRFQRTIRSTRPRSTSGSGRRRSRSA